MPHRCLLRTGSGKEAGGSPGLRGRSRLPGDGMDRPLLPQQLPAPLLPPASCPPEPRRNADAEPLVASKLPIPLLFQVTPGPLWLQRIGSPAGSRTNAELLGQWDAGLLCPNLPGCELWTCCCPTPSCQGTLREGRDRMLILGKSTVRAKGGMQEKTLKNRNCSDTGLVEITGMQRAPGD